MALDPQIAPYVDLEPRVGRSIQDDEPGIGLGQPHDFRFTPGMSMAGPDWQLSSTDDLATWSVVSQSGYMRITIPGRTRAGFIGVSTRQTFPNTEGSVSLGFRIRLGTLQGGPFQLSLAAGVALHLSTDGVGWYTVGGVRTSAAGSDIRADGQWRAVLLSVTPSSVALWEDNQQKFAQTFTPPPAFAPMFNAAVVVNGAATTVVLDISDMVVVSGTDKQVRPGRGLLDDVNPSLTQAGAMADAAQAQVAGLRAAAAPLAQTLHSTNISWWDWFWGRSVDPAMQQGVDALVEDQRTQAYVNACENYRRSGLTPGLALPTTLCLSVGMTITAVVSVSSTVGLNIDLGSRSCQLVVSASGGLASNVSVGFGVEVLFFPRGLAEALGWFFYAKRSSGEGVTYTAGLAGGIPPEVPGPGAPGNIGLALGIGIGAGVLPVEYGAGVSYTWALS